MPTQSNPVQSTEVITNIRCTAQIGSKLLLVFSFALISVATAASGPSIRGAKSITLNNSSRTTAGGDASSSGDECRADKYKIVSIAIPGAASVEPFEINDRRIVSGIYNDAAGVYHSFIWFRGKVLTIDKPGEQITAVGAITDNDLLFGNWGSETEQHAGYYDLKSRKWVQLPDLPGYPLNIGSRMNNFGRAVGYACRGGTFDVPTNCDAWSWNGNVYSVYDFPGAILTIPNGINDRNREVGLWEQAPNVFLGYQRRREILEDLTLSTAAALFYPTAYDINNNGDILAAAPLNPTGYWLSIILRGPSSYSRLPEYPGALDTSYSGMNQHEDLVGFWINDPSGLPLHAIIALREH